MMIRMAHDGYLEMNLRTREARAMPKLFEDLANAAGRRDYDVLFFRSESSANPMVKSASSTASSRWNGVARVDVSRDRGS